MEINIMTWNIDWFRNGHRTQEADIYLESDICYKSFSNIVVKIKEFLKKTNSVVFLQEVPYKIKTGPVWKVTECYERFCEAFNDDEYNISKNALFCTRYTLSISRKSGTQSDTKIANYKEYEPQNNRTIAMEFSDNFTSKKITILGVHMPTKLKEDDVNSKMWDQLIGFTESFNTPLIIVGDFNAYEGCKDKRTDSKYNTLLEYVKDVVSPEKITFIGKKLIDHVLIKNLDSYTIKTYIPENFEFSDHKYIELNIKNSEQVN